MRPVASLPGASLLEQLQSELAATGSTRALVAELPVTLQLWRKTARQAGAELGRPVRTMLAGDTIHALLTDWPATDAEREQHLEAMRAAVNRIPVLDSLKPKLRPVIDTPPDER